MRNKRLKNAPLQEAIFELFWDSPTTRGGFKIDREFEFALGKFASNISKDFPIHKRKIPQEAPIKIYGAPVYQFWSGEVRWPVVQIGPGVLTVNDTDKNYEWDKTYKPSIETAISALLRSYGKPPAFNKVSLKYLNAVDIQDKQRAADFIKTNLQTELQTKYQVPGQLSALNLNQNFQIEDSLVSVNIQTANNNLNNSPAIVWINSVVKTGIISEKDLFLWIDKAHSITSDLFVNMLTPEFYESFNK